MLPNFIGRCIVDPAVVHGIGKFMTTVTVAGSRRVNRLTADTAFFALHFGRFELGCRWQWRGHPIPTRELYFDDLLPCLETFVQLQDVITELPGRHVGFHFIEKRKGEHDLSIIAGDHVIKDEIKRIFGICHVQGRFSISADMAMAAHLVPDSLGCFSMDVTIRHVDGNLMAIETMIGFRRVRRLAADATCSFHLCPTAARYWQ